MEVRFFREGDDDSPHVYRHGVTESEVREAFLNASEDGGGTGDVRVLIGRTESGRLLRVVYVPDPTPDAVFVISAYQLGPAAVRALRRRMRRRS